MMSTLLPEQPSAAQQIQEIIDSAIADKGRETVSRLLGLSKIQTDQFCSNELMDKSDINVELLSELLAGLGISLCPADAIPVEKSLVQWAWLTCRNALGTADLLKKARVQYELHFNESILKMRDE